MTYSIIGSGKVGSALAHQFARHAVAAGIANTQGADSMAALVTETGDTVTAMTVQEALKADIIILAVPFRAHAAVAAAASDWTGKIIIDAMNTYGIAPEELGGRASSELVADAFPGATIVKTFNQLPARLLAMPAAEHGGRRVMFVSSNDEAAASTVTTLVEALGFAPISLGKINEGGALIGMGGALILQNLIKH